MVDWLAGVILLLLFLFGFFLWFWARQYERPHLKISSTTLFNIRNEIIQVPYYLLLLSLFFFCLAFIDPHDFVEKEVPAKPIKQTIIPTEGIAIYLVLDQSGSMGGEVSSQGKKETKMDLLKRVSKDFVLGNPKIGLKGRPNDLIGLVTFARGAQVFVPLTLDHTAIVENLKNLTTISDVTLDGTSIGYAIFKTANLIAATRHYAQELAGIGSPPYEIKNSIMVVVTDGLQSPSPLDKGKRLRNIDLIEAAEYAKTVGIKIYIVNVEPRIAGEEFSAHRSLMKKAVEITGGKFYLIDNTGSLDKIYNDIDQLEKSILPAETLYAVPSKEKMPEFYTRRSLYPYLIAIGMMFLFAAVLLECTVMKRIP